MSVPRLGLEWTGRNVRIPYEQRPNRARRVRSYPVTEINDCVYMWHDLAGSEPLWSVPDAFDVLGEHVSSQQYRHGGADEQELFAGIHVHPQVIAENAVDPHHFRFVHRTPISPVVLSERTDDTTWHAKVGFGKRWADGVDRPGDSHNTIEIHWSGIGVSFNGEQTAEGVRVISICSTPVDAYLRHLRRTGSPRAPTTTSVCGLPRLPFRTTSRSGTTRRTWTNRLWRRRKRLAFSSYGTGPAASTQARTHCRCDRANKSRRRW